jgi:hypothetical protein
MITASSIQWGGYILYLMDAIPWNLDMNPILFTISFPAYTLGIFKYQLFDLVPVARETGFENMKTV